MIRKILVPVRGDGKGENVLNHAVCLAQRYLAHVVVSYCRARPQDMLPFGVPIPAAMRDSLMEQAAQLSDVEEEKLREEAFAIGEAAGAKVTEKPDFKSASLSWKSLAGRQVDVIKQYGRLADLICVAQPDRDRNLGTNTLKAALFNTGRPVVMCPVNENKLAALGENITIAWNGSTEAARAVALNGAVIEEAKSVTILTAGGEEVHGATAEDLKDYLALRGQTAKLVRFEPKAKIGLDLINRSKDAGADLMIMGAYSDSHERETVFGGNTQTVVDRATMPVVLVH